MVRNYKKKTEGGRVNYARSEAMERAYNMVMLKHHPPRHHHRLRLVPKMTMPSAKSADRQRVNAGSHVTFATTGTI